RYRMAGETSSAGLNDAIQMMKSMVIINRASKRGHRRAVATRRPVRPRGAASTAGAGDEPVDGEVGDLARAAAALRDPDRDDARHEVAGGRRDGERRRRHEGRAPLSVRSEERAPDGLVADLVGQHEVDA